MALKDLSDKELRAKMSQRLTWLEKAYLEVADRLKEFNMPREAARAEGIAHQLMATHAQATVLEYDVCQAMNEPMEITLLSER